MTVRRGKAGAAGGGREGERPVRLRVATWNINSIRSRLKLVEAFVAARAPDVLLLQETRCGDDHFPSAALAKLGFPHVALNGRGGHHGVAICSRVPLDDVAVDVIGGIDEPRHVSARVALAGGSVRLHSLYIPSGGDEPDPDANRRFRDKLAFVEGFAEWGPRAAAEPAIVAGDFNIAPLPEDVWSHRQLLSVISHTPAETERLDAALAAGRWVDVVRRDIPPPEPVFTWWSYRNRTWPGSNRGRRLDHVWAAPDIAEAVAETEVFAEPRGWEKPSDHVPVLATVALP